MTVFFVFAYFRGLARQTFLDVPSFLQCVTFVSEVFILVVLLCPACCPGGNHFCWVQKVPCAPLRLLLET